VKATKEMIDAEIKERPITQEEVDNWSLSSITQSSYLKENFLDILNGKYSVEDAREDILSFRKKWKENID
jgi:hypothetical protein